jgi:lysozyme family protein
MADITKAVQFTMQQEDSTLSGVITNRPMDRGGVTRFGLTQRWHPDLDAAGFFAFVLEGGKLTPKVDTADALAMAQKTYSDQYSEPLMLAEFSSDAIATALLSFAVVEGTSEAVTLLQKAILAVTPVPAPKKGWPLKTVAPVLVVDGKIGPQTVTMANATDQTRLLAAYVSFEEAYFQHIASAIPSQTANLKGWINRAKALLALTAPATSAPASQASPVEPEAQSEPDSHKVAS